MEENLKNTSLTILNVCLLILLTTTTSVGQETTIKACFAKWFPFSYMKDGKALGFSIDLYKEAIKKSGMKISFEMKPWKRCVREFSAGKVDALVDGSDSIPNSLNVRRPPIPWVLSLWIHEDSPAKSFLGYSQFDNTVIGYVRGYTYPPDFLNYTRFKKKYSVTDDLQGLKMLEKRRYEAFIGDVVNNTYLVKENNMKVRALSPAIQVEYLTLSFSNRFPEEHKKFEVALNKMYEDGIINIIYQKYLGVTYTDFIDKYGRN